MVSAAGGHHRMQNSQHETSLSDTEVHFKLLYAFEIQLHFWFG